MSTENCCNETNTPKVNGCCPETTECKPVVSRNVTCNFNYMKPTEGNIQRIEAIRNVFVTCENELRHILTPSRETSCCWTDLEKACMMAIKGVCLDGEFSV